MRLHDDKFVSGYIESVDILSEGGRNPEAPYGAERGVPLPK